MYIYLSYDRWCLIFLKARLNRLVKGVPQGYGLYLVINRKVCCMDRIYYLFICYIYNICSECTWILFHITPFFVLQCCFFLVPHVLHVFIYVYIYIPHWYHSWPFGTDGLKWTLYYIPQWRNSWSVEKSKLLSNRVLNISVWCQTSLDERSPARVWLLYMKPSWKWDILFNKKLLVGSLPSI